MPNVWTVTGQPGATMDATARILGTDLDVTSAAVSFRSCSPDTFTYTIECDDSTPAYAIPDETQQVTLYRDGVKFFTGIVTNRRQRQDSVTVTVSGPWWYLDNYTIETQRVDGTGIAADRPQTVNGGNIKDILDFLINLASIKGIPITLGTVSNYFNAPTITQNQMTFGQAISEFVRLVPDAMAWFDYSGSTPALNITRRGVATTRTIDITDCSDFEANPLIQLNLTQIKIPYVTRAINGRRRWQTQTAGTPVPGRIGVMVGSGPEMDTFLPDEPSEGVAISMVPTNSSQSTFREYVNQADANLKALVTKWGGAWWGGTGFPIYTSFSGTGAATIQYHTSSPPTGNPLTIDLNNPRFTINGVPISGTKYMVVSSSGIPDWLASENGVVIYDATLTVEVYVTLDFDPSRTGGLQPSVGGVPEFAAFATQTLQNQFNISGSFYSRRSIFIYRTSVPVKLSDSFVNGMIYRSPSFVYGTIPSDFASNLLAAQQWTPYEGRVVMPLDESGGTRYRGCKVNVTGSRLSEHSGMGALVESEELDLLNDTTTLQLGAPPRVDYQTWVDKSRRTPQDNIIYT